MFLTPVHPKKKFVDKVMAAVALDFSTVGRNAKRRMAVKSAQDFETSRCRDFEERPCGE
jgi:hypothetical protein